MSDDIDKMRETLQQFKEIGRVKKAREESGMGQPIECPKCGIEQALVCDNCERRELALVLEDDESAMSRLKCLNCYEYQYYSDCSECDASINAEYVAAQS